MSNSERRRERGWRGRERWVIAKKIPLDAIARQESRKIEGCMERSRERGGER